MYEKTALKIMKSFYHNIRFFQIIPVILNKINRRYYVNKNNFLIYRFKRVKFAWSSIAVFLNNSYTTRAFSRKLYKPLYIFILCAKKWVRKRKKNTKKREKINNIQKYNIDTFG